MIRWLTIPVLVLGVMSSALAAPPQMEPVARDKLVDPSSLEPGSRAWLKALEAARYDRRLGGRTDNCPHSYDVLHYNIGLEIDFDYDLLYGDTRVISVSQQEGLSEIDLDLTVLTVDAVLSGGDTLSYTYADPVLTVDLGQAYSVGDSFEVEVVYHGHPGNEGPGGFGGFWFGSTPKAAYQMGVGLDADPPSMGKYWFPCWDWPCDKATAEYHITVPLGKMAVCNGDLIEAVDDSVAGTSTFFWSETHQIAPHVMSVAARRYDEIIDSTYPWIHHWVCPYQVPDALVHFENVHVMMEAFLQRYGAFPFDRFGYVAAPKGDMEHQTCITHNEGCIVPNHAYDWLLAHEMAHQWWGDCVSVNTWPDVWLSEGFATYSESIFREHAYGVAAYHDYVQSSYMTPVFNSQENFPVYDPDYLWGTTVYEKGAIVLHMLRHVLGDSLFFQSLAAYRQAYEHQSATTAQFQQVVESVSGQGMGWFFDEWVYDIGWPEYEYSWCAAGGRDGFVLSLIIDQVQTNGPVFTMPLDVGVTTAAGDTLVTLWVDGAHGVFLVDLAAEPTAVTLDPDNWILNEAQEVATEREGEAAVPARLSLEQNVPNPFNPATTIAYSVPAPQHVCLEIYNAAGQRVCVLVDGLSASGRTEVVWDGRDERGRAVASGTYFCRMSAEDGTRVRRLVLLK